VSSEQQFAWTQLSHAAAPTEKDTLQVAPPSPPSFDAPDEPDEELVPDDEEPEEEVEPLEEPDEDAPSMPLSSPPPLLLLLVPASSPLLLVVLVTVHAPKASAANPAPRTPIKE
jgi:hypothetical protein